MDKLVETFAVDEKPYRANIPSFMEQMPKFVVLLSPLWSPPTSDSDLTPVF